MDALHSISRWGLRGVWTGLLVVTLFLLSACADDPILGPTEDDSTSSGGSYSSIKRLAPADSAVHANSSQFTPKAQNPERF